KLLADLAEIYVNDAFGTAHRAHASMVGVPEYLPAVAGYLMKKEIEYLDNAVENPQRPLTAIIGGKKVSDKISVLKRLLEKCDNLLIGGGMAYTFLKSQGLEIGNSILDESGIEVAKEILSLAKSLGKNILLPVDITVADEFNDDAKTQIVSSDTIPSGWQGLDIGPKTTELFVEIIQKSKTVIWNGPVGVFELDNFAKGTQKIAEFLSKSEVTSIIGGGDTAAAIQQFGLADKMTHISTGGGASLELLEGKILPGLAALDDA
ncbi:MAG: phosphoglycerate kinase, partial [Candidatus Hodarchaeales archaeon]